MWLFALHPTAKVKFENERGIIMKNDRSQTERRAYRRYPVQKNAFVILRNGSMNSGQITEISLGGMVFRNICKNGNSPGASEIDIMLADFTDAFVIRNLHVNAVSDRGISEEPPVGSTRLRKQVISFGNLTPSQTSRLKYFIRFYTSSSVWSMSLPQNCMAWCTCNVNPVWSFRQHSLQLETHSFESGTGPWYLLQIIWLVRILIMDSTFRIFEIIMLVCFGSSWPFAVAKTLRTKVVKGKSPVFLGLIFLGYTAGILNKIATNFDHVIWLYCLNGSMVLTEIILYLKYEKPDLFMSSKLILKNVIKYISWKQGQVPDRITTLP